jgi:transposase
LVATSTPTPDTNACEQAIRPFVLGRKNWLFSGSPRGATASATLFSVIETAKANGQEPYWYLRKLFDELPSAKTDDDILRLAPAPDRQGGVCRYAYE